MSLDRRGLAALATGHAAADLCQGSVPALIPFLIAQRHYSYGAAGVLLLCVTVGSSIIQPLFGAVSDRLSLWWLMPTGVLLAAFGIAGAGLTHRFGLTAAAVGVGGLGVAAFHPEGARYANYASGPRRGTGMSLFSVGGNAGFALGPILLTPAVLALGLSGAAVVAILPLVAALVLLIEIPKLRARTADIARAGGHSAGGTDDWGAFARLTGAVSVRSGVYFGLQSFAPVWFVHHYGTSVGAGNAALSAMLVAGALGTLVGGRLVDRIGRRRVLLGSMSAQLPLLLLFLAAGDELVAGVVLAAVGFVTVMSFSVTVVMGQEYLPTRLGIASGVTLGLAIGVGGVAAALLGALADGAGLSTVMWVIALLPIAGTAIGLTLPESDAARRSDSPANRTSGPAQAGGEDDRRAKPVYNRLRDATD
jgi:FSR family fosmidomycin resistance protein-like MFS transporter